jgi:DNA-damage-inducible protein J
MQNAVINFTTEEKTKKQAQKVAKKMGVSLSMVLNHYLREFIKNQKVEFNVDDEIPNAATRKALKESEEDVKAGRVISFDNPQDALSYLDEMIKNDSNSK